jgi:hypothetical protein
MPIGSVIPSGVTEIAEIAGAVIIAAVVCETLFSVAVITVEPAARPVTAPVAPTVATPIEDELQVTNEVKSALLPSL